MARKTFDELVDDMNASDKTPAEWSHEAPEDWSRPESKTEEEPAPAEDTPAAEPEPEPTPAEEPKPAEEPAPAAEEPPKKDEAMDELENTNSIIRKRLEKQSKKYEDQIASMKADYEQRLKALEERTKPKPEVKTRKDFEFDEDYVQYLTRTEMDKVDAEKAKAKAEADAEAAKQREAEEAEQASIKQRQNRFLANIDECFEGDERTEFLKRVQYANSKGLGDLLDSCPMASDYLLGSEKGPLVLQKIMSDADTFRRVFPVKGLSPMEQFYTLKEIERQCISERTKPADTPAAAPVKPTPKLGKPGSQGSGGTLGDPMADPKSRRDYVRNLLYGHK